MLWNYGTPSLMRSFKSQYVVAATDTVSWYKSEESYSTGGSPVGSIDLVSIQKNSRGSVIKQTAACWPYIGPQDCPKATDPARFYFGVQYFDGNNNLHHLVLAATSDAERKGWVTHIAQLIPMYLPADAPSLPNGPEYIQMASEIVPYHKKKVLDGEAPKH